MFLFSDTSNCRQDKSEIKTFHSYNQWLTCFTRSSSEKTLTPLMCGVLLFNVFLLFSSVSAETVDWSKCNIQRLISNDSLIWSRSNTGHCVFSV